MALKNNDVKTRILRAADEDIPNILDRLEYERVPNDIKQPWYAFIQKPSLKLVTTSFTFFLLAFLLINFMPTTLEAQSTVYIEFNPSVALLLDNDDQVIELGAENTDGEQFIQSLNETYNINNKPFEDVIDMVIEHATNQGYLNDDNTVIMYDVLGNDLEKAEHLLEKVEQTLPKSIAKHNVQATMARGMASNMQETVEQAKDANVSVMQYHLIETILDENDTYTFEELAEMSIKELFDLSDNRPGPPVDMPGRPHGKDNHPGNSGHRP